MNTIKNHQSLLATISQMLQNKACAADFVPTNTNKYVHVEVSYRKGGRNMWYGTLEKRGYELSVSVREATEHGFTFIPMADTNFRFFLGEEVSRKSKKAEQLAFLDLEKQLKDNVGLLEKLSKTEKAVL